MGMGRTSLAFSSFVFFVAVDISRSARVRRHNSAKSGRVIPEVAGDFLEAKAQKEKLTADLEANSSALDQQHLVPDCGGLKPRPGAPPPSREECDCLECIAVCDSTGILQAGQEEVSDMKPEDIEMLFARVREQCTGKCPGDKIAVLESSVFRAAEAAYDFDDESDDDSDPEDLEANTSALDQQHLVPDCGGVKSRPGSPPLAREECDCFECVSACDSTGILQAGPEEISAMKPEDIEMMGPKLFTCAREQCAGRCEGEKIPELEANFMSLAYDAADGAYDSDYDSDDEPEDNLELPVE